MNRMSNGIIALGTGEKGEEIPDRGNVVCGINHQQELGSMCTSLSSFAELHSVHWMGRL